MSMLVVFYWVLLLLWVIGAFLGSVMAATGVMPNAVLLTDPVFVIIGIKILKPDWYMSEKHITLKAGDKLVITVATRKWHPRLFRHRNRRKILTCFSPLGIQKSMPTRTRATSCSKATSTSATTEGPAHGDPYHQSQTAYWNGGKCLNADVDKYIVVPPQIRSSVPGVVMGCQAKLTNLQTNVTTFALVGDIGPSEKTGEAAYCAAKIVNPKI